MKLRVVFIAFFCFVLVFGGGWWYSRSTVLKAGKLTMEKQLNITVKKEKTERSPVIDFIPLRMSFMHSYDASYSEGELSGDGKIYLLKSSNPKNFYGDSPDITQKVLAPRTEDWKVFFDACEHADLWGFKEEKTLPEDYYEEPLSFYSWRLHLEYPERVLNIEGREVLLAFMKLKTLGIKAESDDAAMQDPFRPVIRKIQLSSPDMELYASCIFPDDSYFLISKNLNLSSKYKEIQSIWNALSIYILKMESPFKILQYE